MINKATIADSVNLISQTHGFSMNVDDLIEDIVLLAEVWPDKDEFLTASLSIRRAIRQIIDGKVAGTELSYGLTGWYSYHFQHVRQQGMKADMRIVYQPTNDGIIVKGFGNRHLPKDIYRRLRDMR
ncbi:MAG: hypothetical protein E6965_09595 [Bifidobacterium bifidum]|nr:hypothetical protein [Bifidobacterium bifidum]